MNNLEKLNNNEDREKFLDDKLEEIKEQQEAELLIDFDQALKEKENKDKPYTVKFEGKYFNVPREMPFDFSVFFFRHCLKKKNGTIDMNLPEDKMMEFIKLMFGADMLRALETSKKRPSIDFVFSKLSAPILEKWGYGQDQKKNK